MATRVHGELRFCEPESRGNRGFLDGEKLELTQLADLTDALDEAIGR